MPVSSRTRWRALLPHLKEYAVSAWVGGTPTTLIGAARALEGVAIDANGAVTTLVGRPTQGDDQPASSMLTAWHHLAKDSVLILDETRSRGGARVVLAWNFSGLPADLCSARPIVEALLAAPESPGEPIYVGLADGRVVHVPPMPRQQRHEWTAALRSGLAALQGATLARHDGANVLLERASRLSARDLARLPLAVKRAQQNAETGERYAHRLRQLLRWAGTLDLVPLFVAPPSHAHPWAAWAMQHGLSGTERPWLYRWHAALQRRHGHAVPSSPEEVDVVAANEALAMLGGTRRGRRARTEARALLVRLGVAGAGPYRALADKLPLRRSGRSFAPRWQIPVPESEGDTWRGTRLALEGTGVHQDMLSFVDWYADYCTLSSRELNARYGTVERRAERRLKLGTQRQRRHAIRVWVGLARDVLHMAPDECTPQRLFGERFVDLLTAYRRAHEERVAAQERLHSLGVPVPGHEVTHDSPTVARDIVNAGLLADGCVTWAAWRRHHNTWQTGDAEFERSTLAWRAAYQHANDAVAESGASLRTRRRTQKDVAGIVGDVAALALVRASNARVLELIAAAPNERTTAVAVQRGIVAALVATGAPRIAELALVTYDHHVRERLSQASGSRRTRFLMIPGEARKNCSDLEIPLIEELVPEALWRWHRKVGRSLLRGGDRHDSEHDFVFCQTSTGAPTSGGRLSAEFTAWRLESLHRHPGFDVVAGSRGHHGPHAERSRMTALLQQLGEADRLPHLLGHKSSLSTLEMYGKGTAEANAETLRLVLHAAPWARGREAHEAPTTTIRGARDGVRRAQVQLEAEAALGRALAPVLSVLEDLSPIELQRRFAEIAEQHRSRGSA